MPDLTGTVTAGPPYAVRQAEVITRAAARAPAILIGHSGAGPLLPAAAAMTGGRAAGCVFVDAGLPMPGQAWMDTVPAELADLVGQMADDHGWLPPWPQWWGDDELARMLPDQAVREAFAAGCPRLPLAMFTELHPAGPRWPEAPAGYLLLSQAYEHQAAKARHRGWPVTRVMTHHLAMLTEPARIASALDELIREIPS